MANRYTKTYPISKDDLVTDYVVKLNLVNRDDYSRERLNAAFGLKISKNTLTAEKKKFVRVIAEKCGYY